MVLLLLPLRVTTIVKLSIVANFHVVNLSFRLNEMVVNTNCKESAIRLLCQIATRDDVKCVIFCEKVVTQSVKIHADCRFIKQMQKTSRLIFSSQRNQFLCLLYSIQRSDPLNCKFVGANVGYFFSSTLGWNLMDVLPTKIK